MFGVLKDQSTITFTLVLKPAPKQTSQSQTKSSFFVRNNTAPYFVTPLSDQIMMVDTNLTINLPYIKDFENE